MTLDQAIAQYFEELRVIRDGLKEFNLRNKMVLHHLKDAEDALKSEGMSRALDGIYAKKKVESLDFSNADIQSYGQ